MMRANLRSLSGVHSDSTISISTPGLLKDAGRVGEAEEAYRRAIDAGDTGALVNLGILLQDAGRVGEAEEAYRRAIDAGHTDASRSLLSEPEHSQET